MKVGIIGTGVIGATFARALAKKGIEVWVTERGRSHSAALAASHGVTVADNQAVVDACEVICLCVRPEVAGDIVKGLNFRADQRIVSAMTKLDIDQLIQLCAPATNFVRTIPFEFVDKGGCPLPAFGNVDLLNELFGPDNVIIPVADEAALSAHFSACTVLPATLDLIATAESWLTSRTGDGDGAGTYVTQLVSGYLDAMSRQGANRAAEERDAIATSGTLSLQMVETLREAGMHNGAVQGFESIEERLKS